MASPQAPLQRLPWPIHRHMLSFLFVDPPPWLRTICRHWRQEYDIFLRKQCAAWLATRRVGTVLRQKWMGVLRSPSRTPIRALLFWRGGAPLFRHHLRYYPSMTSRRYAQQLLRVQYGITAFATFCRWYHALGRRPGDFATIDYHGIARLHKHHLLHTFILLYLGGVQGIVRHIQYKCLTTSGRDRIESMDCARRLLCATDRVHGSESELRRALDDNYVGNERRRLLTSARAAMRSGEVTRPFKELEQLVSTQRAAKRARRRAKRVPSAFRRF